MGESEARGKSEHVLDKNVARRTFLKGTTALVGLAALSGAGCSSAEESPGGKNVPEEEIHQGLCRGNCGGGCRVAVHVREGKVVKTSPILDEEDPLNNLICPRGYSHPQRIYAPERVQYPMRRVEGTERGAGEWERLSWDDAIEYICDKWKGYRSEFGDSSIAYSYGAGTYAQNYYVYMRLFNSMGSMRIAQQNDMTMLNYSWKMFGMSLYTVGNSAKDEMNAKTIVVWGTNATTGTFARWKYMMAARDKGAKIIVIDPSYTHAAQMADVWLPIKPDTDGALALSLIKYWHDNELDDKTYLRDLSVAPLLVRQDTGRFLRSDEAGIEAEKEQGAAMAGGFGLAGAAVEGNYPLVVMNEQGAVSLMRDTDDPMLEGSFTVNGIAVKTAYTMLLERCEEWTIEAAAKKCELSEDQIIQFAEMYLDGPTSLHTGFGIDHRGNGDGAGHALFTLPIVSGQIGKNGAGLTGNCGGATSGFAGENWMAVITSKFTPGQETNITYLPQIMETQSWNGNPLHLKSVFFYAGNPFGSYSGTTAIREAFEKVELVVTAETVWSDTAQHSDVVLPVPHWFEYETYRTVPQPFIDFNEASIEPQFESKPDTEIIRLLGLGMDLGPEFDFTNDDIHSMFLESEMAEQYGISWETLKEVKRMRIAPDDFNYGSYEMPWLTDTGRAEFYFENVEPEFDKAQTLDTNLYALPFQADSLEAYDTNPLRETYPINLISFRDKFKVHTTFAKCPWFLEIQPEPTIELNPEDAKKYDITEDDYVEVYNDRGFVVLKAHLDAGMRPGMARTEHSWLREQYVAGQYSDVTSLACTHFFPTNIPFDTLVAVKKYEKEA